MSRPKPEGYNELLYAARMRKGWTTQVKAASEVTKVGRKIFRKPNWEVTARSWKRWESPNPGLPTTDALEALTATFNATYEELGFVAPLDLRSAGVELARGVMIPPVNRREVLAAGTAAAIGALPWLSSPSGGRSLDPIRVGDEEIDDLRRSLSELDALDQRFGGDLLWRGAQHTLYYITDLLERGVFTEGVGDELHAISGSLTTSIGWFCYDAGRTGEAAAHWERALNTALLSDDDPLIVRTLSVMARQAVDLGHPRAAVRYAQRAGKYVGAWAPARVQSLLAVREAQGYAAMGDTTSVNDALLRAWRAFERGTTDYDPQWAQFLNEAELVCLEGMCRNDLGDHEQAVNLLSRSAQLQDTAHDRNRGMCLVRLSGAALHAGDLDQSIDAAEQSIRMIGSGMTSRRNKQVLLGIASGLNRYDNDPRARHTIERITQYAA
ncbi:tetratricopeptide repeat protein [Kitasatospora sp. NPDC088779]|uniref:tetratricopeptide repeat protein n=1 Tax=Kitasatospora sp. NPDC088779 TaxID=3154964 RepID=UPI00342166E4